MGSTAVTREEAGTSRLCHGRMTAADVSALPFPVTWSQGLLLHRAVQPFPFYSCGGEN